MTDEMLNLQWNDVVLYPAGHYSRDITFAPSVKLPLAGSSAPRWRRPRSPATSCIFKPVTLRHAGRFADLRRRYFKRVDLDPGAPVPVHMDIVADAPKYLGDDAGAGAGRTATW